MLMPIRQTFDTPGHSRQAGQLRDQLQGLLPAGAGPASAEAAHDATQAASDGANKLLDYVRLAAEYWGPIMALAERFARRAPKTVAEAVPVGKRRFGVSPFVAAGITVGLGLAAYGVMRAVQDLNRNA